MSNGTGLWNAVQAIRDRRGATAIEYALIATLISIVAIAAMQGMGTKLTTMFNNVSSGFKVG